MNWFKYCCELTDFIGYNACMYALRFLKNGYFCKTQQGSILYYISLSHTHAHKQRKACGSFEQSPCIRLKGLKSYQLLPKDPPGRSKMADTQWGLEGGKNRRFLEQKTLLTLVFTQHTFFRWSVRLDPCGGNMHSAIITCLNKSEAKTHTRIILHLNWGHLFLQ